MIGLSMDQGNRLGIMRSLRHPRLRVDELSWVHIRYTFLIVFLILGGPIALAQSESPTALLRQFCSDCHDASAAEGDLVLQFDKSAWMRPDVLSDWESAHAMVSRGIMPPPDADQPTANQRARLLGWIDRQLVRYSPVGGTQLRRLSRKEYEKTIQAVFGLPQFRLSDGFPPDNELHGFDNQGESLVVSRSHLQAFADTAKRVADEFFAPPAASIPSRTLDVPANELVISYSSACLIDGAMRLASSGPNVVRHATWPTKFEAPASGRYKVSVTASSHYPATIETPRLSVSSMTPERTNVQLQQTLAIEDETPTEHHFEMDLDHGETVVFQYVNGPYDYDDKPRLAAFLEKLFQREPDLFSAWQSVGNLPRGGSGWARLKQELMRGNPKASEGEIDPERMNAFAKKLSSGNVNVGEMLVYKFFEEGPYVGIHSVRIEGPVEQYPDQDDVRVARQRARLMGKLNQDDEASLESFFDQLLSDAFRRRSTERETQLYVSMVRREVERTGSFHAGMHLAIRTCLISPSFLYRSVGPGMLNDEELASRLSYFLTLGPLDASLRKAAASGRLSQPAILRKEASRLLHDQQISEAFVQDFTRQWLTLDTIDLLMPDKRLIRNFTAKHREGMQQEVQQTFRYILDNDLPVTDFIAPDFLFTNDAIGWDVYELDMFKPPGKKQKPSFKRGMQRVSIDAGGRHGGLLSMAAVMMATANGVDTQPVLRGVWVLDNILGTPPPDPPKAVPALTPDTAGATSPKDMLAAHMADQSCANCHREIDPLGFVLENYDPIGRWRENYPRTGNSKKSKPIPVDAAGEMPGGVPLSDVTDLKRWLAENPQPFARCVSEKLLAYATGRPLNYRERKIVASLVQQHMESGRGFRDLVLSLIDSEIFRQK